MKPRAKRGEPWDNGVQDPQPPYGGDGTTWHLSPVLVKKGWGIPSDTVVIGADILLGGDHRHQKGLAVSARQAPGKA